MFVDRIKVKLIAGKGGDGIVAWRREKFIPKGGPYGGNGGPGGNIMIEADSSLFSLELYRHKKILKAENGGIGGTNLKQGHTGSTLHIKVPFGTLVKDPQTGEILHDFTEDYPKWTACLGGKGGKGNHFFKSSTRQAPNFCTLGKYGEEKEFELELKLIADIGLVGMPNAGKSTLMSKITHARVKIGAYPFTTLSPNLSYVQCEDYSRILVADIPGIIENAHLNKGLGLAFLKHVERTSALVYVLDILPDEEDRDPLTDLAILQNELRAYDPDMLKKPFLVVFSKMDKEGAKEKAEELIKRYPYPQNTLYCISAEQESGLSFLTEAMRSCLLLPSA